MLFTTIALLLRLCLLSLMFYQNPPAMLLLRCCQHLFLTSDRHRSQPGQSLILGVCHADHPCILHGHPADGTSGTYNASAHWHRGTLAWSQFLRADLDAVQVHRYAHNRPTLYAHCISDVDEAKHDCEGAQITRAGSSCRSRCP